ncbi:ABC transporter ATP-binding protein [Herbiconiux moechotypicola]|uniref:ABC transporter ATP-binding protein n=1 Tax=Herbiconiux moechotypicola TaxID=637393 RepID=A0ABN3DEX8_9MICO|nr:ABC transporter ATP-binding protein [Herbiconiux moechotypicola]MCS5729330.1 ABC transporter ATP-binding protein [Herbiconiux moechotypicola]
MTSPAVRLTGVSKHFGPVAANRDITLSVAPGSIHGLLGENGAGKSTLMKILFGMIHADSGAIEVGGAPVSFRSSADALAAGIGMVQQHFSLIPTFTVVENLVMGRGATGWFSRWLRPLDVKTARERAVGLSERFGFGLDPDARCGTLSVGARQKVEILKALWGGATTLVLDEPTAALSPPEAEELYLVLERLRSEGTTIILISHKLPEIVRLCDRVTVLRDGTVVGDREIDDEARTDARARAGLEADLVRLMIGRERPETPSRSARALDTVLEVRGLGDGGRFGPVDLDVAGGEIVAVVGVEGNGQSELIDLLIGASPTRTGSIELDGRPLQGLSTRRRLDSGIAHIPEDRHERAIADDLSLTDNASFGFIDGAPFAPTRFWLGKRARVRFTEILIERRRVRASSPAAPIGSLSGGNQQKLVVGRELARAPRLMIAAQPTRGLDIASTTAVHEALVGLRDRGSAVLLVSLDLTEVFTIADRIVVVRGGRIVGETSTGAADVDRIGAWMSGAEERTAAA